MSHLSRLRKWTWLFAAITWFWWSNPSRKREQFGRAYQELLAGLRAPAALLENADQTRYRRADRYGIGRAARKRDAIFTYVDGVDLSNVQISQAELVLQPTERSPYRTDRIETGPHFCCWRQAVRRREARASIDDHLRRSHDINLLVFRRKCRDVGLAERGEVLGLQFCDFRAAARMLSGGTGKHSCGHDRSIRFLGSPGALSARCDECRQN